MHVAGRAAQLMLRYRDRQAHNSDVGRLGCSPYFQPYSGTFLVDDSFSFHCPSSGGAASPVLETSCERLVPWSLVPSVRGSSHL